MKATPAPAPAGEGGNGHDTTGLARKLVAAEARAEKAERARAGWKRNCFLWKAMYHKAKATVARLTREAERHKALVEAARSLTPKGWATVYATLRAAGAGDWMLAVCDGIGRAIAGGEQWLGELEAETKAEGLADALCAGNTRKDKADSLRANAEWHDAHGSATTATSFRRAADILDSLKEKK